MKAPERTYNRGGKTRKPSIGKQKAYHLYSHYQSKWTTGKFQAEEGFEIITSWVEGKRTILWKQNPKIDIYLLFVRLIKDTLQLLLYLLVEQSQN